MQNKELLSMTKTMELLSAYEPKKQPTINGYCLSGKIPAVRDGNQWYIPQEYVDGAIEWRKSVKSAEEMIVEIPEFISFDEKTKKLVCRNIFKQTKGFLVEENTYSLIFAGHLFGKHKEKAYETICSIVGEYYSRGKLLPIAKAAELMGVTVYKVKQLIKSGNIRAEVIVNDWYVPMEEIERYIGMKSEYIGLFDFVSDLVNTLSTTFELGNSADRIALNAWIRRTALSSYLVSRDEIGIREDRKNVYYFPKRVQGSFEKLLRPYLKHYGMGLEKFELLSEDSYWESHPRTKEAVDIYAVGKNPLWVAALMEVIIETLENEIFESTDDDIDNMVLYASLAPTQIYELHTAKFLRFVKDRYDCVFQTITEYDYPKSRKGDNESNAYPVETYFLLAYLTFNDEVIENMKYIYKAVTVPEYAFVWLYVIWHYIAFWRASDIYKIPIINPGITLKQLKKELVSGEFDDEKATNLALKLERTILGDKELVEKTKAENLHIHMSVSLLPVIGRAYAACLVHFTAWGHLPEKTPTHNTYREFYGDRYDVVMGMEVFSNRRANKSFADSIVNITELKNGSEKKVRGYIVAAYARSHTKQKGKLPSSTYRYLSYKMDGLSDNEIMMLLWDTGTCSFVINMLLETVYGDKYSQLPIKEQTEIIKMSGLDALSSEMTSKYFLTSYFRASNIVNRYLASFPDVLAQKKSAKDILINIIEGTASSKTTGIDCFRSAIRLKCETPSCDHCVGCDSSIIRISSWGKIMEVVKEAYLDLKNAITDGEKRKCKALLEKKYLPSAIEYIKLLKLHYGMDTREYEHELMMAIIEKEK